MSKKMLVNATHLEENRVGIVLDGILTELDIEVSGREPTKGNIYKAVVVRVEPGLQAAFVDYGAERLGFLQIDEVNFETVKPGSTEGDNARSRPRINDLLHRGQEILVQITKEERGTKGAALTTYLSLAGRYMVCMPGSQTRGVSRKVESDAERKQLKKAMGEVDLPEGFGYIVRTAGLGKSKEELQRDFNYLKRLYDGIRELGANAKAPALLYKESNLVIRSIRDYFTTDMDEVLIDDPDVFKEAKDFFQRVMPEFSNLVKLHQERRPIFSRYQIEDQIETINQNKVPLASGGSIVIDPTEALVSIDVNSGKMTSEQGVESTAFKTNLEAADEVGRQLRLRDLGGLIVIDFIDMRDNKHNRAVENQLRKSLESDKARISVGRISKFGLLEMSRQRIKAALADGSSLTCPHCQGSGRIKSSESLAVGLVRRIHAGVAKGQISHVDAKLPLDVASYLLNDKREDLHDMERRYNVQIHIHGYPHYLTEQIEIEFKKREKEKPSSQEYVEAGSLPLTTEPAEETSQAEPEPAPEADDKPKKKRRRRRRKPASDKTAQDAAQKPAEEPQSVGPESAEQAKGGTERSDQPSADKGTEAAEAVPTETKRPKRRRSSRKKPDSAKPGEEPKAAQQVSSKEPADAPAQTEQTTEPGQPAAPQPKRRSSRSSTKPKTQNQQDPAAAASNPPADTSVSAAAPETVENKPKEEQKPRRRRTPRKKTETRSDSVQDQSAEPATAAVPGQTPGQPATVAESTGQGEKTSRPKPKRRSGRAERSAKTGEKSEQSSAAATGSPPANQTATAPPAESSQAEPEKPKRRRSPRRKTTEKAPDVPQETTAKNESPSTPSTSEAEPKPSPKRRPPRKKTAPAANNQVTTQAGSPEGTSDQPPAATENQPKRQRAPRRQTGAAKRTASPANAAEAEKKAETEDKPKPRTRRKPSNAKTDQDKE